MNDYGILVFRAFFGVCLLWHVLCSWLVFTRPGLIERLVRAVVNTAVGSDDLRIGPGLGPKKKPSLAAAIGFAVLLIALWIAFELWLAGFFQSIPA